MTSNAITTANFIWSKIPTISLGDAQAVAMKMTEELATEHAQLQVTAMDTTSNGKVTGVVFEASAANGFDFTRITEWLKAAKQGSLVLQL